MTKLKTVREVLCSLLVGSLLAPSLCLTVYGQTSHEGADEVREFEIFVGGKSAGTSTTRISENKSGETIVNTDAFVTLGYIVYTYRYEFHGKEVWKDNRLVSIENRAVDDGKSLETSARNNANGSVIKTNDKGAVTGPVLSMTTSYWRAPERQKGDALNILDADQGTIHAVRIEGVTEEQLVIGANRLACTRYRLSGDLVADLWFDAHHRLVRQQTMEDGHPVELRLTRINMHAAPFMRP